MNKFKKAISVGMSATLLASLFTVIAAGTVLGATTVTSAGSVPRGGTSTGTVTITLTENDADCLVVTGEPASTIVIDDVDGGDVTWSGTAVVSAPDSLGATVTRSGDTLTVDTSGAADGVTEQIVITGLTITAATTATPGAIVALLADNTAATCWTAATRTATGTVSIGIAAASTEVRINNTNSCDFVLSAGTPGGLAFATLPETVEIISVVAGPGADQQTLGIDATSNDHQLGEQVSQTGVPVSGTCPATLSSPGTVVDALEQIATTIQIFPGENNQVAGTTTVSEVNTGFLGADTVVTFTLTPDGVLFSGGAASPTIAEVGATTFALTSTTCAVSVDRKSCTATVDVAETVGDAAFTLGNISLDVAATVPAGTLVKAVVTTSPSKLVNVTSNTIAVISRVIVGVAAQPTIYINENDQSTGQISLTEQGAGFFTAGPGPTNAFAVCLQSGESFTRAPWAVVVTGDLKLFSGLVGAASSKGTLYNSNTCARWSVFTASTVASTIEIRGTDASDVVLASGATNGPRVNVPNSPTVVPGPTLIDVFIGTTGDVVGELGLTTRVSNAVRAFRNQPVVAAVSQVVLPKGTTNAVIGNITITETQAGQFKAGDSCNVQILEGSLPAGNAQVVRFVGGITSNMPLVSTNVASGLLVGAITGLDADEFNFEVTQQAVGTLGVITITNMHVLVLGDALNQVVQVNVDCNGAVDINQTVSPARVGAVTVAEATINRGLNTRTGFGFGTESVARGAYVTIRSRASGSAAGDLVQIWTKTKTTAWKLETNRRVSPNGFMYYSGKVLNLGYRYYRVVYPTGAVSNTVRAFGK